MIRCSALRFLVGCCWLAAIMVVTDANDGVDKPKDLKEYLYLQEEPAKVYPIKEYFNPAATSTGKVVEDHPDFLYDPNYPHPRIVEFYASWCPHCKHFKPQFIQFAKQVEKELDSMDENVVLEIWAVSCVPNHKICKDQGVHGYPTLQQYPAKSLNGTVVNRFALHPKKIFQTLGIASETYSNHKQQSSTGRSSAKDKQQHQQQPVVGGLSSKPKYFKARSKQETYQDAHRSLIFALRNSIFASDDPLSGNRKSAFKKFLTLLQKTAPASASFQPLLKAILADFENYASADSELNRVLDENPLQPLSGDNNNNNKSDDDWSPACMQHGSGYTCGLWQLFHIMTVGLVEWNSGTMDESQMIVPHQAAEIIRNFIEQFFQCEECRVHFLNEYDSCGHDRCNRLAHDKTHKDKSDWIQFPLWFYETHNGVNARLRQERIDRQEEASTATTAQEVLWPPVEACPKCWLSEGRWEEDVVYSYLRLEYWPEDYKSQKFRNQVQGLGGGVNEGEDAGEIFHPVDRTHDDDDDTIKKRKKQVEVASISLPMNPIPASVVIVAVLAMIVLWQRKRQFDKKGYHKKQVGVQAESS